MPTPREAAAELVQIQSNRISDLEARVAELEQWKEEAQDVLNGIKLQEVSKELRLPLGRPIGPEILPRIQELKSIIVELVHAYTDEIDDYPRIQVAVSKARYALQLEL